MVVVRVRVLRLPGLGRLVIVVAVANRVRGHFWRDLDVVRVLSE